MTRKNNLSILKLNDSKSNKLPKTINLWRFTELATSTSFENPELRWKVTNESKKIKRLKIQWLYKYLLLKVIRGNYGVIIIKNI